MDLLRSLTKTLYLIQSEDAALLKKKNQTARLASQGGRNIVLAPHSYGGESSETSGNMEESSKHNIN